MSFKKRAKKSIALALVGVTVAIPMSNTVSAMENEREIHSKKIESDFKDSYGEHIGDIAKDIKQYVELKDNQFILNIPKDKIDGINSSQLNEYKEYLNTMNKIIEENNITDVSLEGGFTLEISDSMAMEAAKDAGVDVPDSLISTYAGISKFQWTTGGFDWWLTDFQAGLVIVGATAGAGVLVGMVPGIGWKVALSVANAVIGFAASNSIKNGIKISYRFNKYLRITAQR